MIDQNRIQSLARLCASLLIVSGITFLYRRIVTEVNSTTIALTLLLAILGIATEWGLLEAIVSSVAGMLCFNFFFLPPVGTFTIADPQNWVALFAFLAVSLVASNLSSVARARTQEAVTRRDELARLLDLSRDVLLITDSEAANSSLAGFIARRFDLDYVAICLPHGTEWIVFESGSPGRTPDPADLSAAFSAADASDRSDAAAPSGGGHRTLTLAGHQ